MIKNFEKYINEDYFSKLANRKDTGDVRKENSIVDGAVDLGLKSRTLWAECNLGAKSPDEYGDYYAWGETETKSYYTLNVYKMYNPQYQQYGDFKKYTEKDGKNVLDLEDDAANVILGGNWHIPTKEQVQELIDNTIVNSNFTLNGTKGVLFKSKINGNELFLPFAGYKYGTNIEESGERLRCWTSSLGNHTNWGDGMLCLRSTYVDISGGMRYCGYTIRAVLNK